MSNTAFVALLGIVGTLLGTLAGVWFQFLIEKRLWLREDRTRFRELAAEEQGDESNDQRDQARAKQKDFHCGND